MKNNIITLLSVLSFYITVNAQNAKENKAFLNAITISPFSILDPIHPTIQIGYQRALNDTWETQVDVGYLFNKVFLNYAAYLFASTPGKITFPNRKIRGFKVRTELKRIYKKRRRSKAYLSAEIFYIKRITEHTEDFTIEDRSFNYSFEIDDSIHNYKDTFVNNKFKVGLNIKWGMKIFIGQLLLEPHAGIGAAYRVVKQFDRENTNDRIIQRNFFSDNELGNKIILSIPINLRVGYRF